MTATDSPSTPRAACAIGSIVTTGARGRPDIYAKGPGLIGSASLNGRFVVDSYEVLGTHEVLGIHEDFPSR